MSTAGKRTAGCARLVYSLRVRSCDIGARSYVPPLRGAEPDVPKGFYPPGAEGISKGPKPSENAVGSTRASVNWVTLNSNFRVRAQPMSGGCGALSAIETSGRLVGPV